MIRTEKVLEGLAKPLSSYDFLGYVAPGGTLLLAVYLFERWCRDIQGPVLETAKLHTPMWTMTSVLRPGSSDWVLQVLFLAALLAVCYVTGHVVASVSSLAIDRVFIGKGYGYPMFSLLGFEESDTRRNPISGAYYRGLFFWLNLYLILRYFALFLEGPTRLLKITTFSEVAAVAAGYLILISVPIKVIATSQFAAEGTLRRKFATSRAGSVITSASCFLVRAWAWLYDHVAETVSRYLFTREPASPEFTKLYCECFSHRFQLKAATAGTNNFWFAYMHMMEKSPTLGAIATNWLRLYAFARNLSAAFYLFFLYTFFWLWLHSSAIKDWEAYRTGILLALPLGGFALALIMLTRFYYLYASYYTRFVFRSFVYLSTQPAADSESLGKDW